MVKLTIKEFDQISSNTVFARGVMENGPNGLNMTNPFGGELRWVAKKGYKNDWAVYCFWSNKSEKWVLAHGDKIMSQRNILKCVNCEPEVLNLYRY